MKSVNNSADMLMPMKHVKYLIQQEQSKRLSDGFN